MSGTARCSVCGCELSHDASPQGMCANCLLKLGLSSANIHGEIPAPSPAPERDERKPNRFGRRRRARIGLIAALFSITAIVVAGVLFLRRPERSAGKSVIRFTLSLPGAIDFAVSPDGRRLAFTVLNEDGKTLLAIHQFDGFHDAPLSDTEGAAAPFWSPDSRSVGYFARGKLKRVDVESGASETLCDAPTGQAGAWSPDGVIIFERAATGVLYRVSDGGGIPAPATRAESANGQAAHRWPSFLRDGRHFIYTAISGDGAHDGVFVASLDGGASRQIVNERSPAMYADHSLLFIRAGMLLSQRFDDSRFEFSGEPRAVRYADQTGRFSISSNGLLVYRKSESAASQSLAWFDRAGKIVQGLQGVELTGRFSVSPDGRRVAVSKQGDIWISDLDRGVVSRYTYDPADDAFPIWSPDGSHIAFVSSRGGRWGIYQTDANGAAKEELLAAVPRLQSVDSWSPDGRFIFYTSRDDNGKSNVWTLPLSGERKPFMIPSEFNLRQPRFSPDGRWLAYVSDEDGSDQIYIESFPPGKSKWQASTDGGTEPRWSSDGRELSYIAPRRMLMSIAVRAAGTALNLSAPRALFRIPSYGSYETSRDNLFLISLPKEEHALPSINVVVNWAEEIRR